VEKSSGDETRAASPARPEELPRELERALHGVASCDAVVVFRCGEDVATACTGPDDESSTAPIRIGCIAKLLTATLARRAFEAGALAPDDDAGEVLHGSVASRLLRGITLRHLLDHTHGLDDSRVTAVPRHADARIDVGALARALRAAPALAPPGAIYSYGSAGAWLVAALLERLSGRQYAEQVRREIIAPLEIREHGLGVRVPVCPATGAAFALEPKDLLRFVAHAALENPSAWPDENHAGAFGTVSPLPGWHPLERGVHLGWKFHGCGWFGHQSVWPGASVLVRAHPRRALAFVVASREHSAAVVAARVLGCHLPELFDVRIPARPSAATAAEPSGTFGSAAWRVAIQGRNGGPVLSARRPSEHRVQRARLHPLGGGVLATRPSLASFPHVEVVTPDSEGTYLWNGRFVLRRIERRTE